MKHPLNITIILILLFFISQIVGVSLVNIDASVTKTVNVQNQTVINVVHNPTAIGDRPTTTGVESFILITVGIILGTLIMLGIMKIKKVNIWRIWYIFAVWLSMSIAFGVLLPSFYAMILALLLAWLKMYKRNPVIHNLTEIFVYAGITVLLAPILNILWAFILLLFISLYDMFAVWKSKHMVKMAMFQTKSQIFAGLSIPKKGSSMIIPKKVKEAKTSSKAKGGTAILGGGDIAFPMIFTSVAMENLILRGVSQISALYYSLIIILFSTIAISLLFLFSKKGRFYPAMPFITTGCVLGFVVMLLMV